MTPVHPRPRTQETRDYTFYLLLLGVSLLLARLVFAYAAVLMFSTVVVLVTWPLYTRIRGWVKRPELAAVLTTSLLATVVFLPLGALAVAFFQQGMELGRRGVDFLQAGGLAGLLGDLDVAPKEYLPEVLLEYLPASGEVSEMALDGLQTGAMYGLQQLTTQLPSIIASAGGLAIDAFVFLLAVPTFYVRGPALLTVLRDILPLEENYVDALFEVFGDLANRAVGGAFAIALLQGMVATLGYAIAGVDGLVFFGSLTALFAFVPMVGGAVIYLPLVVLTLVNHGLRWGLFLLIWQVVLTAQVDTFLRPMFLRGLASINPLLIFVSVFGGLGWLGLPGALAGPFILVAFIALYTIYKRDFLGHPDPTRPGGPAPVESRESVGASAEA